MMKLKWKTKIGKVTLVKFRNKNWKIGMVKLKSNIREVKW